ncbi:MAG: glycosyltransferase family 2 protein [Butyrivibrio sp.]|nr:glycosyltransferase family 2 protein [Butyrivibrio sp.]
MIKVSVVLATYNHEKYIEKAISSTVQQKCNFEYEVLVGDDASTDNTGSIVRQLAGENPGIVNGIVRERNLGAAKNIMDLIKRARGKYIAFLEGDDYWIDEYKLQKQVDFLDSHPDYVASFGRSIVIHETDERDEDYEQYFPWIQEGEYTVSDMNKYLIPGQTATAMYRKQSFLELLSDVKKDWRLMPRVPVVDRFLILGMMSKGKIFTMADNLAVYRFILDTESGSWSSKHEKYSLFNAIYLLYGLKEMERIGKRLNMQLCFDEMRNIQFSKVAEYKGQMPIIVIDIIRFFIWLWYKDKRKFIEFIKERHS